MGEINLSRSEKDALSAIDSSDLYKRVDLAISTERVSELHHSPSP